MTVVYIVSDSARAGKTAFCASLARIIERRGNKVSVFKLVAAANATPETDPDVAIFNNLLDQPPLGWPLGQPNGDLTSTLLNKIKDASDKVRTTSDVVIVEDSPIFGLEGSKKVAEALSAKVLGVSRYRQDLTASELKEWKQQLGNLPVGFVVNGLTRYMGYDVRTKLLPSMKAEGLVSLGVVPEDRRLLGVRVAQVAEHLKGRFVACEENGDTLVEHIMVGGMGMDPGELYFGLRKNKAVIVRGDRPDIQMAALMTSPACIVLTNGVEPIEYVKYEAEQEQVSTMVVETDTLDTMVMLGTLMNFAHFDHPLKLDRFTELLEQHVDLSALLEVLELQR